jgi:hypothetical protein
MAALARIRFATGSVCLPAQTPYECQCVFDFADSSAKRFGVVRLELDGRAWAIKAGGAVPRLFAARKAPRRKSSRARDGE